MAGTFYRISLFQYPEGIKSSLTRNVLCSIVSFCIISVSNKIKEGMSHGCT